MPDAHDLFNAENRFLVERRKFVMLGMVLVGAYKMGETDEVCERILRRIEYQAEEMFYAHKAMMAVKKRRNYGEAIH